jgi:IclR family acetate operon transcriptional repressor
LAQLDDVDVQRVLNEAGLPRHTPSTITSFEEFYQELDRVRLVGFGVDNEEESEGIVCVGAPIFDHQRHCAGAISLTGLRADMADGDVGRLGALVRDYAERVTKILSGGR